MATATEWRVAFARQAAADLDTFFRIASEPLPDCHKLLFLQMGCEKLVKAHLISVGSDPADLQTSHAYTAKNLQFVIRQHLEDMLDAPQSSGRIAAILRHLNHHAREIEFLSPSVRGPSDRRPDNCEYPWEDGDGAIRSPLDWAFYPARLMYDAAGRDMLKRIREAIDRYLPP